MFRDSFAKQAILILPGTPPAGDGDLDAVAGGVHRRLLYGMEQAGSRLAIPAYWSSNTVTPEGSTP
jgi:hypothetical protein